MDISFTDPSEVPLPPGEVRIRDLRANPWPDGRRVRVYLEVDPFQQRPNADLVIHNSQGQEVAHAHIIESIDREMEVTMHLRAAPGEAEKSGAPFTVQATLYYATLHDENSDETPDASSDFEPIERQVVDQAQASFRLPDDT